MEMAERRNKYTLQGPEASHPERARTLGTPPQRSRALTWTDALGWFSIGLGVAQVVAPRQVARWIGVDEREARNRMILSAVGLREISCGVGLLSGSRPATWTWARVAGDVLDLALLASALESPRGDKNRTLLALASVALVTGIDASTGVAVEKHGGNLLAPGIRVHEAVTIAKGPEEVYSFFRDFQNLPRFMSHLEFVRVDNGRSHWRVKGPLGSHIEWDAEIVEDIPGALIAWRSVAGADVPNYGRVLFKPVPGGRDTELSVELSYDPPVGSIGAAVAKLFGEEPSQQIKGDLGRLKQVLETGEVLHSDSSIHRGMHPARPSHDRPLLGKELS